VIHYAELWRKKRPRNAAGIAVRSALRRRQPIWLAYLAAAVLTGATLILRLLLEPEFGADPALVLLLIPISLSAYVGGVGPGLAATAIAGLGASYYLPPSDSFRIASPLHSVEWLALLAAGTLVSVMTGLLRRARHKAEANDRLRAVTLASIGDGVVTTDVLGRVTFLNPAAAGLTGWTTEDAQGRAVDSIFRLVNAQTGQPVANWADTVRRSRGAMHLAPHTLLLAKDGRRIPVGDSGAPIVQRDGTVEGLVIVFRDRTQEYATEAALREKVALQERLAVIADTAPGAIVAFRMRPDGTLCFPYASPQIADIFGLQPEQLVDDAATVMALVPPDDRESLLASLAESARSLRPWRHAWRVRNPRRGEVWVEAYQAPAREPDGSTLWNGFLIDVTERKRAEDAIQRQANLLEISFDGILVRDPDGTITFWNQGAERMYGYTAAEAIGRASHELLHTEYPAGIAAQKAELLRTGAWRGELRQRTRSGALIDVESRQRLVRTPESGPLVLETNRDITDRKRSEESLRRSQKMEALGTLAGGVAHDFNNLLLAITGNTDLAAADLAADHPVQEQLAEIGKASARAADLVRRILAFTRQSEPRRLVVQLESVIREALQLLRSTLPAMIEIRADFAHDIPAVAVDPTQVHQIVMNLLTNAAYAIGEHGGSIEVALDALSVGAELAATSADLREGFYARLTVRDSGCGMDRATLERIFDPFFTTKPPGQGTGLGLSAVHGIVRSYAGAITVQSEPGAGATFRVYLPAVEEAVADAKTVQRKSSRVRSERVLYVDDEEALVLLVTRALRRRGYRVIGFSDPARAFEWFRSDPQAIDVAVADLSMPGMSGFDLARAMRQLRPELPIVMTSGYLRPEDQDTAARIGIRDLILKPNTVEALGEVLDRLFHSEPH